MRWVWCGADQASTRVASKPPAPNPASNFASRGLPLAFSRHAQCNEITAMSAMPIARLDMLRLQSRVDAGFLFSAVRPLFNGSFKHRPLAIGKMCVGGEYGRA